MRKISLVILLSSVLFGTQEIDIYAYHNHAPFIIDKKVCLSYDLIKFLNTNKQLNSLEKVKVAHQVYMRYIMTTTNNVKLIEFLQSQNFQGTVKTYAE